MRCTCIAFVLLTKASEARGDGIDVSDAIVTARNRPRHRKTSIMKSLVISVCLLALVLIIAPVAARAAEDQSTASPRLILVHYMPWFEADAGATQWGWPWTLN